MTVFTHVASRPESLVSLLCEQLVQPSEDVFARELVAVPTSGIERWLTHQIAVSLATRGIGDGICANVDFPSPRRLVHNVLREVPALAESVEAWDGPDLVAHLVAAIDENLGAPWMRLLERYLETENPESLSPRRLSAANKIGRFFSAYSRRRPDMIRSWATGNDLGADGAPLGQDDLWQPLLWRDLRSRISVPSLPELLPQALEPVRAGTVDLDLPGRLAVYGLTAMDPHDLDVLIALGEQRDVHLYVLHPSPALWATTADRPVASASLARSDDDAEALAVHPLLKVWGRDTRELQHILAAKGLGAITSDEPPTPGRTLLSRIQRDIAANEPAAWDAELAAAVASGADRSLQIHIGHGDRRQAEVLRDAILHALSADPSLEPRDIVVMTPDLDAFSPLLEAAFPRGENRAADGLPDLRLRVADRSPAAINPLVRFTATLLSIADGRFEAGVIRELVARPVVQNRFGFDSDTAGELVGLVDDATVAWGLDGTEREAWGAGSNDERTWQRGLDRVLTGVFYGDDALRVIETTTPMDGLEGQVAVTAGLLANLVDRLTTARENLDRNRPMSQWAAAISRSVRLLAAPGWGEEWQLDQLERLLIESFPAADTVGAPDPVISLREAGRAIADWTEDRPSPLHFRTGDVTVCTLAPMRSVPYRVVCLLGMDEDRFPRSSRTDGDDLLLRHEIVGDHSRSAQDRQLLLDAAMAAGETLIVTYSGRDELTNAELPPAVPVAELTDVIADMVGPDGLAAISTQHPLQAFSADNFTPGTLGLPGSWGFDSLHLDAARAVQSRSEGELPSPAEWPAREVPERVRLDDLVAFLQHPCKRFLRDRLGFSVPKAEEGADDTLPSDLNALAGWSVKEQLLSGLADGHDLDDLVARLQAADALPPGDLGNDDLDAALDAVRALWGEATSAGYSPGDARPITGDVGAGGIHLEGTVLADPGRGQVVTITPSRLKGKRRIQAFAQLAFLTAVDPETEWQVLLIGKMPSGVKHLCITLGPLGTTPTERQQRGTAALDVLVGLYLEGMQQPLALPCETAFAWQTGIADGKNKEFSKASGAWEKDHFSPEADDPAHQILLSHLPGVAHLLDAGLDGLAARLWEPILAASQERKL